MNPKIEGFRTRQQLQLRNPRSVSYNISPKSGGVTVHWGGPRQNIGSSHSLCESVWRSWQNYHMNGHGWVDLAYTAGFCNHGYVLAGRGYGVRTAANGTNIGNQNYYAFVWIGGSGNKITLKAFHALEWLIRDARVNGGAGNQVRPHTYFTSSQCPGPTLTTRANRYHNVEIKRTYTPKPKTHAEKVQEWLMSLPKKQREVLESLSKYLADNDVEGHSFARQLLTFHREERGSLKKFLEGFQSMSTNPHTLGRTLVALTRRARISWNIDPDKFKDNRSYTKDDLETWEK